MDETNEKVMMIGLDGATWSLLDPWISDNRLPTFKKLMNGGSRGVLRSTIPCQTMPAIPSLFTGMNPGNTGVFSLLKHDGSVLTLQDAGYPAIWNILDRYKLHSCIANVRFTFPPEKLDGIMICGYPVPSDESNYTYPKGLKEEIGGFLDDKIEKKVLELRDKKGNKTYREELVRLLTEQTETRYRIFKKLNQKNDFDFSVFWIDETDTLQHFCWEYKNSLLKLYLKIDSILKDILSSFPNVNLFIVSDHGFESNPERFFFVNTWLHREGYLKLASGVSYQRLLGHAQIFAYRHINSLRLRKMLMHLKFLRHNRVDNLHISMERVDNFPGIDKRRSKAYLATLFGIDINDSEDYDKTREEIIRKLEKLEDSKRKKVVKEVKKKEEVYEGKYLHAIPDIIFLTSQRYLPFPALTKNVFGEIKSKIEVWKTGWHARAREGILIAFGPTVRKREDLGNANIEDLTPTILHLMRCEIPTHINGRVLTEIFERGSDVAKRKPLLRKYHGSRENQEVQGKDEGKMMERLKELGYI